jgi:hypothetical protein
MTMGEPGYSVASYQVLVHLKVLELLPDWPLKSTKRRSAFRMNT